jgi:hypothetical protein
MNNSTLNEARQKVADARGALAAAEREIEEGRTLIKRLNAQVEELRARQEAKGLRAQLAAAEAALIVAEEVAVKDMALALANEIMKRQASDPLRHHQWVITNVMKLREMIRSELDTPLSERYTQHPLLVQALSLVPQLDAIDRPVHELGHVNVGATDWATRRRAILAAAESAPLEAA